MIKYSELKMDSLLKDFIPDLLQNGYKVFVPDFKEDKKITWIKIVKDNKIGSVSYDYFGYLNFSTVHKPCKEYGTGFVCEKEVFHPTLANAVKTSCLAPWRVNTDHVKKYKDWQEFHDKSYFKYNEVIL